jgi:hypothetical protein
MKRANMDAKAIMSKMLYADDSRRSRFHTASGELVLSTDILNAFSSTLTRHFFDRYPELPWLTYPAIRFLDQKIRGRRLFEFGSGMSTRWLGKRCPEVHSVENNAAWFRRVESQVKLMPNVHLKLADSDAEMIAAIASTGGRFEAILVDSQPVEEFKTTSQDTDDFRVACLRAAMPFASDDCLFIIDNTDAMVRLSKEIDSLFVGRQVQRFSGWVPGIFHPNETTIVF